MKCPTINLVQLFILLFTVIETGHLANGLESISQLEKNNFKELMPEFKQQLLRWMSIKKQASKLKKSNTVDIEYLDCALCRASVESVQFLTGIHMDNAVIGIIRNFCIYLHIETVNVCEGIVESFKVSSFSILFNLSFFSMRSKMYDSNHSNRIKKLNNISKTSRLSKCFYLFKQKI